jgi:guanine nucleotide exchange factor for Rho/Rac/Cdc42-like GTPase family protein
LYRHPHQLARPIICFFACSRLEQTKGLDLGSFLIKPVQRILKYPLLLRELVKNTPDDHPDRLRLDEALAAMSDVAQSINEEKRNAERTQGVPCCNDVLIVVV